MKIPRRRWLTVVGATVVAGCAGWSAGESLRVSVVGVETLPGEGMELRLLVKLRVQNAGETGIDFDGVALKLDLRGMSFASGVSAEHGSVPRFGECVVAVPVTISAAALLRQALSLVRERNRPTLRIDYVARGRLGGGWVGGRRFESAGEIDWPPVPAILNS